MTTDRTPAEPAEAELLPGEGETRTRTEVKRRRECERCGAPATRRVTYLLDNCRSNPASSGYLRDDCSWCSDSEAFACDRCQRDIERDAPDGMSWCSTFGGARFPHMLLDREEVR